MRGSLLALTAAGLGVLAAAPEDVAAQTYPAIEVLGDDATNGIYDPSVEYTPDGSVGWLAYSAVYGDATPWGPNVETRLARSVDGGTSWSFERVVNASAPAEIEVAGTGPTPGFWNYEVASLVHDPGDAGREWKLFAHRIFRPFDPDDPVLVEHLPQYSWIALRHAPDPSGPWSSEIALFSNAAVLPDPFATQVDLATLDPSLAPLPVFSEPGAFAREGTLYVCLTGLTSAGADRIVLLASDDHGASWRYVATLLSSSDATALGYLSFDGASLVQQAGRVFLLASPRTDAILHDGTLVFEFEDLALGQLVRESGLPVVRRHVPIQPALVSPLSSVGGGQADYHEGGVGHGIVMGQLHLANLPRLFRTFATGQTPIGPEPAPALGRLRALLGVALAALAVARLRARRRWPGSPRDSSAPASS